MNILGQISGHRERLVNIGGHQWTGELCEIVIDQLFVIGVEIIVESREHVHFDRKYESTQQVETILILTFS